MRKRQTLKPLLGWLGGLLLLLPAWTVCGQTSANAALAKEAAAQMAAQDWASAIKSYETLTQSEPANGRAWNQLGYALHQSGEYQRAATAFRHAADIGVPGAVYNLACAYAKQNDKEQAFTWLRRALENGSLAAASFPRDPDWANLRSDARYTELTALADKLNQPCMAKAEHRQFDFWVGDWEVKSAQGQPLGTNKIERLVEGCLLLENWTGAQGGSGKSINFFDGTTGKWHQTWVGFQGNVVNLDGEYKEGVLRFTGTTKQGRGPETLERLTFFNLGPDRVRQLWEQSTDAGKTWNIAFDGYYFRKKTP